MEKTMITSIDAARKWEKDNQSFDVISAAELVSKDDREEAIPTWKGGAISWSELVFLEPQLKTFLDVIKALAPPTKAPWCSNKAWYDIFKPRMKNLVGWSCTRKNPALRSSQAYETAYKTLYHSLPASRE